VLSVTLMDRHQQQHLVCENYCSSSINLQTFPWTPLWTTDIEHNY